MHFKPRVTAAVSQSLLQRHSFYAAFAGRIINCPPHYLARGSSPFLHAGAVKFAFVDVFLLCTSQ